MKKLFISSIRLYQKVLSPLKSQQSCLFLPTCSQYMIEAIDVHGVLKGLYLGFRRLSQCRPGSNYRGYDPIPDKGMWHSSVDSRVDKSNN